MLSGFWPLGAAGEGGEGLSESVKKENLWWKYFFSDNVEWISKYLCKMTSDVKANLNNNRSGGSILKVFIRSTFKTWNTL